MQAAGLSIGSQSVDAECVRTDVGRILHTPEFTALLVGRSRAYDLRGPYAHLHHDPTRFALKTAGITSKALWSLR